MIVRHHYGGKVYVIEFPPGSRVKRSMAARESAVYVQTVRGEVPVFEEPGVLMVSLAMETRYGLRLLGVEERPET
jgi:hypothetical protein